MVERVAKRKENGNYGAINIDDNSVLCDHVL